MSHDLEQPDVPNGYPELLEEIAHRIARSQTRAALAVSRELVLLYWSIGAEILVRQRAEGWGAKVIDRLGRDLQARFPGVEGFSPRNLKYMRSLAEAWPDPEVVPPRTPGATTPSHSMSSPPSAAKSSNRSLEHSSWTSGRPCSSGSSAPRPSM